MKNVKWPDLWIALSDSLYVCSHTDHTLPSDSDL